MPKDWILNNTMNRFQLNQKRNVGGTSENIRKCAPKTLDEWRKYYFANVKSKEHIATLGKKLHNKVTEIVQTEIDEITEEDCIDYMRKLVIDKTFEGYKREIDTIHGQLQTVLEDKIEPASDELDRLYNVDFVINIDGKYIGLQIKPHNLGVQEAQIFKEKQWQLETHDKFQKEYGGKVFYVISSKPDGKKEAEIVNKGVIEEIKTEIQNLKSSA